MRLTVSEPTQRRFVFFTPARLQPELSWLTVGSRLEEKNQTPGDSIHPCDFVV